MSLTSPLLRRRRITSVTPERSLRSTRNDGFLRRFVWWLDSPLGLIVMFALALGIRVVVAPKFGFYGDLNYFRRWVTDLHYVGIRHFYAAVGDTTYIYPPGYLYILDVLAHISSSPSYLLVKFPTILGDLALAWTSGVLAQRLAPAELRRRIPVRAVVVAAVLFNPAVIALSVVWGQVDAIPAFLVVASLLLLVTGRPTARREIAAMILFAAAFAMKPQSSFIFPVLGYALYRRHVHRRNISDVARGVVRIVAVGAPALALLAVSGLPFGLSPVGLKDFYSKASNGYKITSVWAFNLWGVIGFQRGDVRNAGTAVQLVAGVPAFDVGALAFVAGTAYVIWRAHRSINRGHDEARVLVAAAAMTSLIAFTLLTRMHERYLFPVLACLAPLVVWRGFRWIYVAVSTLFILNLWYPLAVYNGQWKYYNPTWKLTTFYYQPVFRWVFGNIATTDTWQKKMWSLFMVVACVVLVGRGFRWVERGEEPIPSLDVVPLPPSEPLAPEALSGAPASTDRRRSDVNGSECVATRDVEPEAGHAAAVETDAGETRKPPHWLAKFRSVLAPLRTDETDPPQRWLRLLPLGLVIVSCVFSLVVLRSETTPANNLNDSAFHLEMVRWADHQISEGKIPLDGWFPNLTLGSSFFHHYQSLPYTLTAYAARITGLGDTTTYLWLLYLMLALWPISVYLGARLLSLERWPAAAAALVSPFIVSASGYGYEHSSYTWQGLGVFTQLWGMWLLPLAWGLTYRAVTKGSKWYAPAAVVLALTIATHLMTGYLAVLSIGVWVLVTRRGFVRRVGRAAIVTVGGLLTAAWVLVPLLADRNYSGQPELYHGTIFDDSYGAGKILHWLFTGELFDHGRFPIFSWLVAVGFIVCLVRAQHSEPARAVLGAWTLSLFLFFGRATWGVRSIVNLLPGNGDLQMHRFMEGVDLAGILLAGAGLVAVARFTAFIVRRGVAFIDRVSLRSAIVWTAVAVAMLGMLAPAWSEVAHYDLFDGTLITYQRAVEKRDGADFAALVKEAERLGGGRIYAGLRANWGNGYRVGNVQAFAELENYDADAIGYPYRTVQSLSTDVDASFGEFNPAQYEILNIKYMILPVGHQPPVAATLVDTRGNHRLYEVNESGYFQVIDVIGAIAENRTDVNSASYNFRYDASLAPDNVYPSVAFNGGQAAPSTSPGASAPAGTPGTVINVVNDAVDGAFTATVRTNRTAAVLLKESFDPRWTVTVDGVARKPVMIAPSLVGVEVPAGTHTVAFRYKPYPDYPILVTVGLLSLLALTIWPRWRYLVSRVRRSHHETAT
jgi:Gpi18-like mannosyltransferase